MSDFTDQGIRFAGAKTTATTFVDVSGVTRNAIALTTAYQAMPTTFAAVGPFQIGRTGRLAAAVVIVLDGVTSFTVKFECLRNDAYNLTTFGNALIQMRRQDDGTDAAETVFTVNGTYLLESTSACLSGNTIISAKTTGGAIGNNTAVYVGVNAL